MDETSTPREDGSRESIHHVSQGDLLIQRPIDLSVIDKIINAISRDEQKINHRLTTRYTKDARLQNEYNNH